VASIPGCCALTISAVYVAIGSRNERPPSINGSVAALRYFFGPPRDARTA
jgi:hypothetical protein